MNPNELSQQAQQFEQVCLNFNSTGNKEAEKYILTLKENPNAIVICKTILGEKKKVSCFF